ncbi:hypothetical protein DFH06DRAFT_159848 [Mycena polygramma]|nr:hypothetical protein DFH06DRAFT_159848 [Mycena polygramma]
MDQDPEKLPADHDKDDPSHDAAAAPMWAVYISEAEKYDRRLVESWKSDMEGILIFAGLFSASLTAFLIESYKTLVRDSGDSTAFFLSQISLQLAASANDSTYHVPPLPPFTPPTGSLVCNVLWFISLGLSLTCALIATLLEQWARDFLHRADTRSSPVIRARVFSFLYYGLKRFRMHTVVEIIPQLLHASLLLFFVGLVTFLIPVNIVVTIVVVVILFAVVAVYTLLTLLPLLHLECSYRTPLSGGFWRFSQMLRTALHRWDPKSFMSPAEHRYESMVEGVFRKAMAPSDERFNRDQNALAWTVKSLADDNELEPFIEAIADVISAPNSTSELSHPDNWHHLHVNPHSTVHWQSHANDGLRNHLANPVIILLRGLQAIGSTFSDAMWAPPVPTQQPFAGDHWQLRRLPAPEVHRRYVYDDHMRRLIEHPHVQLFRRLRAFYSACFKGILSPETRKRRQLSSYKAVWALSCLPNVGPSQLLLPPEEQEFPEILLYQHSAVAMQQWANSRAAQDLLDETLRQLLACKRDMNAGLSSNTAMVSQAMLRLHSEYGLLCLDDYFHPSPKVLEESHIDHWIEEIRVLPLTIYLDYLARAVESKPIRKNLLHNFLTFFMKVSCGLKLFTILAIFKKIFVIPQKIGNICKSLKLQ